MSSREMLVTLNPVQAANGVILPVELPTGPVRLRIPPCRHGDLVRVRVGSEEVLLRVHVSGSGMAWIAGAGGITPPADGSAGPPAGAPAGSPPPPPGSAGRRTGLVAVLALAAVITAVVLLAGGGGDDGDRRDDARPAATASPTASGLWSPAPSSPYSAATGVPSAYPTRYDPVPSREPSPEASPEASPEPSPFDRGTCLNGRLPDSTTPTTVTGVEEVPCSASDAHYRVIESLPGTSDLNACNSNSRTQYAFSYRYTRGGTVLNQYVYCLVGIGSYAR
ncbi:hypothetical protein [Streptomyces sp. NPDC047014]|uniref:LppU/SCO3897 family protein n=1 Tax=Streptomyces sp. NPDC047014 TaxID=3155736 RepID=UPI0033F5118E